MILLNYVPQTLRLTTSSTSEISYSVVYDSVYKGVSIPVTSEGLIVTATDTELLSLSASGYKYEISNIFIVNNGVTSNTISLSKVISSAEYPLFSNAIVLTAGQSLQYNTETGFVKYSASGEVITNTTTDIPDGNYGDVTVGGSGTTMTINNSAVTLAKMANIADLTILGNNSGGSAAPIALTVAQIKAMLGVSGSTIFTQTATATVANTATETTILGSGVGSLTLAANTLTIGKTVRIIGGGIFSSVLIPGNLTFRVKFGSVNLATGAITNLLASAVDKQFEFSCEITCRTTGVSGSVFINGKATYDIGVLTQGAVALNNAGTAVVTDTTASNVISVSVQWSTPDAGNTISGTTCSAELLN